MDQNQDDELEDIVGGTADASSGALAKQAAATNTSLEVVSAPTTFDGVAGPEEVATPVQPGDVASATNAYFSYEMLKSVAPGSHLAPPEPTNAPGSATQREALQPETNVDSKDGIDEKAESKTDPNSGTKPQSVGKNDAEIEAELEPQAPARVNVGPAGEKPIDLGSPSEQPDLSFTGDNQSEIARETVSKETDETFTEVATQLGDAVVDSG